MHSLLSTISIPAGQTTIISQPGTMIFFKIITGAIQFRTSGQKYYGQYNVASAGDKYKNLDFTKVEIQNLSATNAVGVQLVIGDADFDSNEFIFSAAQGQGIAYPTCATAGSSTRILIRDQSGGSFFDINGNKWVALNRIAIEVFNTDTGVDLNLQKFVPAGGSPADPSAGFIYRSTPIKFEFGGDYRLDLGGAAINAIVNEIYNAVPATS